MKDLVSKYSLRIIASGLVLIIVIVVVEHFLRQHPDKLDSLPSLTTLLSLTLNFLDHLAVALISIGIIGLLFEVKEWRERFHTELTNIVNDVDQLIKLRDEEIKARQIRILQAVLKNKEINKEGAF